MKIKAQTEIEISKEEQKRITLLFLQSLLPYDSIIRYDGLKKFWFSRIYDGYGKSVIKLEKSREVTEKDEAINRAIEFLQK